VIAARTSLLPFLLVSSAFHLLLIMSWYVRYDGLPAMQDIPVTIIPPPPEEKPPPQSSKETPPRPQRPPAQVAKKSSPVAQAPQVPDKNLWKPAERTHLAEPPVNPARENSETVTIMSPRLPTLKELLPPAYRLFSEDKPPRLDNRDPRQLDYMNRVEQALQIAWNDPAVARSVTKPHGLEGKSVVQFIIRENGEMEDLSLLRSSGYSVLDQEAIRVVQAAASNFGRLPSKIGKRLLIEVTFIHENSLGLPRRALSRTR